MKSSTIALSSLLVLASSPQLASAASAEGYYATVRVIDATHKAANMDGSARPGIGAFVVGRERREFATGALGAGYAFDNGWRTEGEYSLRKKETFTSGSTRFPTSFNNHNVRSERVMFNVYRDIAIDAQWSAYGTAGAGVARLRSSGWQGVSGREYIAASQNNLAYSLGAGIAYSPVEKVTFDLGYRYVDMGKTESGWNAFGNARGLQDEKMSLNLSSREIVLGARYAF